VGAEVDDSAITTKVRSALLGDSTVKSGNFNIETREGKVRLSGYVDDQAEADHAIGIARGVEGVKYVENKVRINVGSATRNKIDDGSTTKGRPGLLGDANVKK
jgi:hyperosmotically inducible protein